jgi:amino acid transporter
MVFALARDLSPATPLAQTGRNGTPVAAATTIAVVITLIAVLCATAFSAEPFDTFFWSGTIGTLILLVAYVLATIGCIKLVFIERRLAVAQWQVVIPIAALVMLGYTIYRNVWPYPDANPGRWFPVVAFGWLVVVTFVVLLVPAIPQRFAEGIAALKGATEKESV